MKNAAKQTRLGSQENIKYKSNSLHMEAKSQYCPAKMKRSMAICSPAHSKASFLQKSVVGFKLVISLLFVEIFEPSLAESFPGPIFGKHDWKTVILPPTDAYDIIKHIHKL